MRHVRLDRRARSAIGLPLASENFKVIVAMPTRAVAEEISYSTVTDLAIQLAKSSRP